MSKPVLTIFYQFNPWHSSIGGIQTVICSFIKYAPDEINLRLVGVGDREHKPGTWIRTQFEGKQLQFMSLFRLEQDDVRRRIPTSVRYTAALAKQSFASEFMHFHRIEPALAAVGWPGEKTLFIHNDIRQQLTAATQKQAILWQKVPGAYFALERSLIGQFHQIYSCNTESLQLYKQSYPKLAHRMSYLKNPVDTERCFALSPEKREAERQALAQRLRLSPTTQFLLFAGRLHPQKDPLLLLRSFAALDQSDSHLLIAGQGELKDDIETEIQRLNLTQRVTLLGALPQTELVKLQQICAALVLTSLYEGLPIAVLESLACGTPIVTTHCGETPNLLVPGSGLVCNERTPAAIADALKHVLMQPDEFPASACIYAATPYTAQSVTTEVYHSMLSRWQQRQTMSKPSTLVATHR